MGFDPDQGGRCSSRSASPPPRQPPHARCCPQPAAPARISLPTPPPHLLHGLEHLDLLVADVLGIQGRLHQGWGQGMAGRVRSRYAKAPLGSSALGSRSGWGSTSATSLAGPGLAHRLLHGEQRQDLEQVVLDHVAHDAVLRSWLGREAGAEGCMEAPAGGPWEVRQAAERAPPHQAGPSRRCRAHSATEGNAAMRALPLPRTWSK